MKRYVVAVDLGATNIRTAIVDVEKECFLAKIKEKTKVAEGAQAISTQVVENVRNIMKTCNVSLNEVIGIGVGAPGPLDMEKGAITRAVNIPYFVPIRQPLEDEYSLPVAFMNDTNAAALGELVFGAGREREIRYLVFVTISTGIGAGIIDDGRLIKGKDGNAGEVGCITVDYRGRLKCGCGRYGHWQAYSSGAAIPNFVRQLVEEGEVNVTEESLLYNMTDKLTKISAKAVYESAKKGDKAALKIVDELATINAVGIANIINAYNPEIITLGGPIILQNIKLTINRMLPRIRDYAVNRIPEIIPTPLGEDIGLYGAAAAILRKVGKI